MKQIFCILIIFLETAIIAQNDNLPSKVNDAFTQKYKDAQNISWFEDEDIINIDFDLGENYFKAVFSKDGQWIETCQRIENEKFPSKIVKVITGKYPSIQLVNGDLVENKKGEKFYRFFGYTDDADHKIDVSLDGKIL